MKFNFSHLAAMLLSVALLSACSDDDNSDYLSLEDLPVGTYTGSTLTLTYSGSTMMGASVYYTVSGSTPVLTLEDVIPGEPSVAIQGVYTKTDGTISGSATTPGGAVVEYSGSVATDSGMTLALTVTMPDELSLAGTYGFPDIANLSSYEASGMETGLPSTSAVYFEAVSNTDVTDVSSLGFMLRPIVGGILPQVLNSVTFDTDGNIFGAYCSDAITLPMSDVYESYGSTMWFMYMMYGYFTQDMLDALVAGRSFQDSPANLAYWFVEDGELIVKLNLTAIVTQVLADNGMSTSVDFSGIISQILNADASTLRSLISSFSSLMGDYQELVTLIMSKVSDETLNTLLDWVKNGIPLKVAQVTEGEHAGHTHIYLDRDDWDMVFTLLQDEDVYSAVISALPAEAQMASMLIGTVVNYWSEFPTFNLGLDLVK